MELAAIAGSTAVRAITTAERQPCGRFLILEIEIGRMFAENVKLWRTCARSAEVRHVGRNADHSGPLALRAFENPLADGVFMRKHAARQRFAENGGERRWVTVAFREGAPAVR